MSTKKIVKEWWATSDESKYTTVRKLTSALARSYCLAALALKEIMSECVVYKSLSSNEEDDIVGFRNIS